MRCNKCGVLLENNHCNNCGNTIESTNPNEQLLNNQVNAELPSVEQNITNPTPPISNNVSPVPTNENTLENDIEVNTNSEKTYLSVGKVIKKFIVNILIQGFIWGIISQVVLAFIGSALKVDFTSTSESVQNLYLIISLIVSILTLYLVYSIAIKDIFKDGIVKETDVKTIMTRIFLILAIIPGIYILYSTYDLFTSMSEYGLLFSDDSYITKTLIQNYIVSIVGNVISLIIGIVICRKKILSESAKQGNIT